MAHVAAGEGREVSFRKVLTTSEAAKLFGVDPRTVWGWTDSGEIPKDAYTSTPGGQKRYIEEEILKLREMWSK